MFHLEVRFRHAEQLLGSEAETSEKKKEIYTSRRSPAILFALAASRVPPGGARQTSRIFSAAIHWLCNSIANDSGDLMTYDSHQRAAEFHMLAAHAHQAAAAHHGKEDHLTAHEQSRQAMEYASKAFEFSKQAHDESSVIFKKHEKKA
jgi:hypothetical protein